MGWSDEDERRGKGGRGRTSVMKRMGVSQVWNVSRMGRTDKAVEGKLRKGGYVNVSCRRSGGEKKRTDLYGECCLAYATIAEDGYSPRIHFSKGCVGVSV